MSFPDLAAKSGHATYKATLSKTEAVVVKTSQRQMVDRRADGTVTVIKHLSLGQRVNPGAVRLLLRLGPGGRDLARVAA